MPYEIRNGDEVWHKKNGEWSLKQKCSSSKNANIVKSNLEKMESGIIKKFGERMKARKGKK